MSSSAVILSGVVASQSEATAESKDPYKLHVTLPKSADDALYSFINN